MRVTRLEAKDVHGYFSLDINLFPDLTFLTGLNGGGKTTALRLLMGLLTPNLNELIAVDFKTAMATVVSEDNSNEIVITATKSTNGLNLSITGTGEALVLTAAEMELLVGSHGKEDVQTPLHDKVRAHPVYQQIDKMSTPMFLGLNRRLRVGVERARQISAWVSRPNRYRLHPSIVTNDAMLDDVNELVIEKFIEVRASQERLDDTLRNQILLDSFRYEPLGRKPPRIPTRAVLEEFRARQATVEKAAMGLRLPVGPLKTALTDFFEQINKVVAAMEQQAEKDRRKRKSGKEDSRRKKTKIETIEVPLVWMEWTMNSPQADRIFRLIEQFEKYLADRAKLRDPIERFLQLVNGFLSETQKSIQVGEYGEVIVHLSPDAPPRPLNALSSGERQLVVMLAHLSLNKQLATSGVFIVDEPELSLHISWQEKFIGAIQAANPKVQLIMATHSPAIILDRVDSCRSLN